MEEGGDAGVEVAEEEGEGEGGNDGGSYTLRVGSIAFFSPFLSALCNHTSFLTSFSFSFAAANLRSRLSVARGSLVTLRPETQGTKALGSSYA